MTNKERERLKYGDMRPGMMFTSGAFRASCQFLLVITVRFQEGCPSHGGGGGYGSRRLRLNKPERIMRFTTLLDNRGNVFFMNVLEDIRPLRDQVSPTNGADHGDE